MATLTVGTGEGNFTTIQAALDAAKNGDTIFISAGTYSESVIASAKEIDGLIITGETDATGKSLVTWKGQFTKTNNKLWKNVTVSNINFINDSADGTGKIISIRDSQNWTFDNCSFDATAHDGGFGWNPIEFATGGNINK